MVDFAGGDLPLIPRDAPVEPVITLSRGKVEPVTSLGGLVRISPFLRPLPAIDGWRVTFDSPGKAWSRSTCACSCAWGRAR